MTKIITRISFINFLVNGVILNGPKMKTNIINIENIVILLTLCVSLDNMIIASSILSDIINK